MAKLPLPERGQPLDVSYIYNMANVINQMASTLSTANYNYITINTPDSGTQNTKITNTKVVAGYKEVTSKADVEIGDEKTFTYSFGSNFNYPPVVTVTPVNVDQNSTGTSVIATINDITTTSVNITVRFNTKGTASVGVNIIAIGIPSS